jgi:hypothetical protein
VCFNLARPAAGTVLSNVPFLQLRLAPEPEPCGQAACLVPFPTLTALCSPRATNSRRPFFVVAIGNFYRFQLGPLLTSITLLHVRMCILPADSVHPLILWHEGVRGRTLNLHIYMRILPNLQVSVPCCLTAGQHRDWSPWIQTHNLKVPLILSIPLETAALTTDYSYCTTTVNRLMTSWMALL